MPMEYERLSPIVRIGLGVFAICAASAGIAIAIEITDPSELMYVVFAALFAAACAYGTISGRFPNPQNRRAQGAKGGQR